MKRKLPPLNALKAFEASARHLSFSRAADEMFLTQGAISKQIKILEEYFKEPLFERVNRGLKLTKKAEEYYKNIAVAFDSIAASSVAFKTNPDSKDNSIMIKTLPSFGNYWLVPKMQHFTNQYPNYEIDVIIGNGLEIDPQNTNCDIMIWAYDHRPNTHKPSSLKYVKLFDEEVVLVGSKSLLNKKINNIKDLLNYKFVINKYRPDVLENWAKKVGLENEIFKNTVSFNLLYMVIEAVKEGLGLAFIPKLFIQDLLTKGDLINPLNIKYKTKCSYYIVYPKNIISDKAKKISDWLVKEVSLK
jgi:LysR family glycine cleavage system transcriptional activator